MLRRSLAAFILSLVIAFGLMPSFALAAEDSDLAAGVSPLLPSVLTTQSTGVEVVGGPSFYGAQTVVFKGRSSYCRTSGADNNAVRFILYKDGERIASQDLSFTRADWNADKKVTWEYYCGLGSYKVEFFHISYDPWFGGYVNDDNDPLYNQEFTVNEPRKANTMTVKAKTVTVKASSAKKKVQSVKASKAFAVKNARGAVTYKATKNVTKNAMKKVTVAKNGIVTVKKGTKAGTYKLNVKVAAAGDKAYESGSKTVTLTVKVK